MAQKIRQSFIRIEQERGGQGEDLHKASPKQISDLASLFIWSSIMYQ